MTINDKNINYDKIRELGIKNSHAIDEMLKNDMTKLKENSISTELNSFWDKFETKINKMQKSREKNQILNLYVVLSENRAIVINEMDVLEPWFVKVTGVNTATGKPDKEILNSRKDDPEIIVELVDIVDYE
ncbi:hypothetical protein MBCUT_04540 [Methanobrevibacter cuticularis]|uniref:Uncharacterized protein n=1 Tax=Methanobrevibacter cuticularis TaxID=47311 RepID=A0A166EQL8_9EURY|nr:hypothetical protein [Methanobrevibacter cuticularis]KZX16903.1 hypothetical protein MBCUT_04540 [Methanobrevibacter cuticularis]